MIALSTISMIVIEIVSGGCGKPHHDRLACTLSAVRAEVQATPMTASSPQIVKSLLATERDAHRRQRELVRASLMLCPGKTAAHPVKR